MTKKGYMKQADGDGDLLDLDYLSVSLSVMSYSLWPHDCSLPGSSVHQFSRQEYWSC